jgi:L-fuconolactonase
VDELAACPNVVCKLSGLLTEAGDGWDASRLEPYLDRVCAAFGPQRLLYGSDWPVCTLAADHQAWLEVVAALIADWSAEEQAAFYAGNARRVYRL